mgnify:FL=1
MDNFRRERGEVCTTTNEHRGGYVLETVRDTFDIRNSKVPDTLTDMSSSQKPIESLLRALCVHAHGEKLSGVYLLWAFLRPDHLGLPQSRVLKFVTAVKMHDDFRK